MSLSPRPNQVGSAPYAASSSLTAQVSPTRPQPALRVGAAAQRVHHAVQVGADLQAVHAYVVADVDHRGHLGAGLPGVRAHAGQEPGAADSPGQDHDAHSPYSPTFRAVPRLTARPTDSPGAVTTQPEATPGDGPSASQLTKPLRELAALVLLGATARAAVRRADQPVRPVLRQQTFTGLPAAASSTSSASRTIVLPDPGRAARDAHRAAGGAGEADHAGGPGRVRGLRGVRGRRVPGIGCSARWPTASCARLSTGTLVRIACMAVFLSRGVLRLQGVARRTTACPSPSPSRNSPACTASRRTRRSSRATRSRGSRTRVPAAAAARCVRSAAAGRADLRAGYPPAPGYPPYQQQQPPYGQPEQPPRRTSSRRRTGSSRRPTASSRPRRRRHLRRRPPRPRSPARTRCRAPSRPRRPRPRPGRPRRRRRRPGGFGGGRHRTDPAGHRPHPVDQPGEPAPHGRWHAAARARRRGADRAGTLVTEATALPGATA